VDRLLKKQPTAQRIGQSNNLYPSILLSRLGESAPPMLTVVGPVEHLVNRKTALFCSARTPGEAILRAHDAVRRMREEGVTVISGFHSPIEKDCLKILLRGKQPVIICPGRAISSMRIPADHRVAFDAGRILYLSPFSKLPRRVTKESALRRNEIVAALADYAYVAHITSQAKTDHIVRQLNEWKVPIL
jgi:predicted Rossmann fold nucleotide-binding protein DprA/Smf involved in DNA uptake